MIVKTVDELFYGGQLIKNYENMKCYFRYCFLK